MEKAKLKYEKLGYKLKLVYYIGRKRRIEKTVALP
jgi:hypothetical protein